MYCIKSQSQELLGELSVDTLRRNWGGDSHIIAQAERSPMYLSFNFSIPLTLTMSQVAGLCIFSLPQLSAAPSQCQGWWQQKHQAPSFLGGKDSRIQPSLFVRWCPFFSDPVRCWPWGSHLLSAPPPTCPSTSALHLHPSLHSAHPSTQKSNLITFYPASALR